MKRLSLVELKAQSGNVVANLEAIKGGNLSNCHDASIQCGGGSTNTTGSAPGAPDSSTVIKLH